MADFEDKPRRIWHEGIDMAYDLIKRHPELLADCPAPSDILFVLDTVNVPASKGKAVPAKVSKISGKVTDFLDAGDRTWMLEWFSENNGYMTPNQRHILLLQQLLLFEADGNGGHRIGGWDIQEVEIIADRVGFKWASETRGEAPDIMARDFEWGRIGQSRIQFVRAKAEEKRQAEGPSPKPKAEQSTLKLVAELVETFGLDGAKAVVAMVEEAQTAREADKPADDWQPDKPLVAKDNVVQFPRLTGTGDGN